MTAHHDYLELISNSLDVALPPEDQARLDNHLAECPECRAAWKELQWTHSRIKGLEAVEPPPWLAPKIMARIRSETAPQASFWRRFIRPIVLKPQLQVASVLLLAATGFYLLRSQRHEAAVLSELKERQSPAAVQSQPLKFPDSRDKSASEPAYTPKEMQKPLSEGVAKLRTDESKSGELGFAPPPRTAPSPMLAAQSTPGLAKEERDMAHAEPLAAPPPAPAAMGGASVGGAVGTVVAGMAESEKVPARQAKKSLKGTDAPTGANRTATQANDEARGKAAESASQLMDQTERKDKSDVSAWVIRVEMDDPRSARSLIERELNRAGATLLPQREPGAARVLRAQLYSDRLPGLLTRLARIGRVLEQPDLPREKPSVITINISW